MRNNAEGTLEEPFFVALARVDISDYARRVERLYRWYLDQREDEENDEDDDDKENDRTNSKYSRYHPGAAIQKFLNEYYFEPLAKLATKHEGTVLNFAGDAACCVFRRRQRRRRRCRGDDDDDVEEEEEEEAKAALKKRAESFAEEVVRGRWLFSYRLRCGARKVREETEAHFFFRDVRVRIAVASGNAVETFLGGFQGRYERVMFGEACENLAREARKAKPRKLADDGDNPERKGLFRREKKKQIITDGRKTPMITKIQGDAEFCTTVRDETVAIVFIHVSLLTSISTCEARTLGRFVQHAQKLCAHHRGTFLQLGGDEGDSLAIVVAFRTKFAKDSLLAKTVASRNALRFSRAVARWVQKKKNNKNKNKKTKTTKTKRKGKKKAARTPRQQRRAPKITLGVSLGNCALGFVGDRSRDGSQREFLATGRTVNRAARLAKGRSLRDGYATPPTPGKKKKKKKIPTKIPTITLVRIDANAIARAAPQYHYHRRHQYHHHHRSGGWFFSSLKVRVKGGDVWDAFAL